MANRTIVIALLSLAFAGCASTPRSSSPQLTSANVNPSSQEAEAAAAAITTGDYPRALTLADQAIASSPDNAWAHYHRAVALGRLGQVDAAASAYSEAARLFAKTRDERGKGIALYGRAHTLSEAGRCVEATASFDEYAALVRGSDKRSADMALDHARACKPGEPPVVGDPVMTKVSAALLVKDYPQALELTNQAGDEAKRSGWLDYDRAIALDGLDRIDDAVTSYRAAEARFGELGDRHGQAVAIYGRARVLDRDKRCAEARQAYEQYASLVREADPKAAEAAADVERSCAVRP